jgi:hypothetical protein
LEGTTQTGAAVRGKRITVLDEDTGAFRIAAITAVAGIAAIASNVLLALLVSTAGLAGLATWSARAAAPSVPCGHSLRVAARPGK